MPKQIASNTALVQTEDALSLYEGQTNLIGLTTPLFDEDIRLDNSKGWYTGNNRILRVARASATQILTSWEKFWDEDSVWTDEQPLLA